MNRPAILVSLITAALTIGCAPPRETWWMRQTAMAPGGRLDLKTKPWWPRATNLKLGDSFAINGDPAAGEPGRTGVVRRERVARRTGEVEALVWIIDDDGDGVSDRDSDCYVVDYGGDGLVDRMVDYIDDDGDNDPDEMDIRYFENGELRYVWIGLDLDDDNVMWDLAGYEYSANFFRSDPYGRSIIYMNKYDPGRDEWDPISECPFAFYDTDHDGFSEAVVRVSAAPIRYDTGVDPDYANAASRYGGPFSDDMRHMGIVNIRYSLDVDNLSGPDTPLHYDMGFNLVGAMPYQFPGMKRLNPRRRPPQTTCVVPYDRLRSICDHYPAAQTGFSWHEYQDDTVTLGDPPRAAEDRRWEGVFWVWERRFMGNSGGPCQKWNMRREWSAKPANRRELYYSEIDRRIHLFGAQEGWLQIGHFAGEPAWGETRMFDTDGDGYFDRWELYVGDSPTPARISTVRDERARRIPFDDRALHDFYTRKVVPDAMAANEKLIAAMRKVRPSAPVPALTAALNAGSPGERRYVQDVIREMQYEDLRTHLAAEALDVLSRSKPDELRKIEGGKRDTTWNSSTAWQLSLLLESLDDAYGQGDFERACKLLEQIDRLRASIRSAD